jgi:hypothetical protein
MSDTGPRRFIPGDAPSDYAFKHTALPPDPPSLAPELIPRRIQRLSQDLVELDEAIKDIANQRQKAAEDLAQRQEQYARGIAGLRSIIAGLGDDVGD